MKKALTAVLLVFGSGICISGQQTVRRPRETVKQQISRENTERQQRQERQNEADRALGMGQSGLSQVRKNHLLAKVKELYRQPNEEEMKLLAPRQEDLDRSSKFLSVNKNGLIKLLPDRGCATNPQLVVTSDECLKYSMPGAGSSYSFRKETHRIQTIADLTLKGDFFLTTGALIQGILVNIGDVPLEEVGGQTEGFAYLADFEPETDPFKAREISVKLADGVKVGDLIYQSSLPVKENSTYLLRSIAYRGFIQRSYLTLIYDESRWDKRKDVLVAFRVMRRETDGSTTILWKLLRTKNAPKMKM
ncbi:MAG: hypothetical protein R2747_23440 [Pyrinomonadaceae bacterium]